jgi:hypothetical protein
MLEINNTKTINQFALFNRLGILFASSIKLKTAETQNINFNLDNPVFSPAPSEHHRPHSGLQPKS